MKVIASWRSNHIYPVLQLKVSLAFKLPNKIVINRNQWEHQGSAQTLHIGFHEQGCTSGGSFNQMFLRMGHFTFSTMQQTECILTVTLRDIPTLIICSSKIASLLQRNSNKKVIFSSVNLSSQITPLGLRISYVFSSLSFLNLLLSCPDPFVANRVRRSEVFKVDV